MVPAHVQGAVNNLQAFKRTEVMRSNRKPCAFESLLLFLLKVLLERGGIVKGGGSVSWKDSEQSTCYLQCPKVTGLAGS